MKKPFLMMVVLFYSRGGAAVSRRAFSTQRPAAFVSPLHQQRRSVLSGTTTTVAWKRFSSIKCNNDSISAATNVISSPKSATIKKIQGLLTKRKKRLEWNQAVVEGPRMVFDLLNNPVTQPLVKQILVSTEYPLVLDEKQLDDVHAQRVLPEILKNACSDTVTPQGIVAIVDIPDFEEHQPPNNYPLHLVLDGVSDPGNLGTLLRSSLAVGVASVVLLPGCCDVWNPKAVRSAMGATFQVPIVQASSWKDTLLQLSNVQRVFAATMLDEEEGGEDGSTAAATSVPHFDVDWLEQPTAIVIGSEGNGLSPELRDELQQRKIHAAHVPMSGNIESLNAAVCGSVFLFEYQRQCEMANRKGGVKLEWEEPDNN